MIDNQESLEPKVIKIPPIVLKAYLLRKCTSCMKRHNSFHLLFSPKLDHFPWGSFFFLHFGQTLIVHETEKNEKGGEKKLQIFNISWGSQLSHLTLSSNNNQAQKMQQPEGTADHQQNADCLQALYLPLFFEEHQHDAHTPEKFFPSSCEAAYVPLSTTFTASHAVIVCRAPETWLYKRLHAISVQLSRLLPSCRDLCGGCRNWVQKKNYLPVMV